MADVLPSGTGIALGNAGGAWLNTLDLTKMSTLFSLYQSKGDVIMSGAVNLSASLDGPIAVARYGALSVPNGATLSVANRCRGLLLLCDSLSVGASGVITMTARGASGSRFWANQDIMLPTGGIKLSGRGTSYRDFALWLAANGYFVGDPSLYASPPPGMGDVTADYSAWPSKGGTAIVPAGTCGASPAATNGTAGGAGTLGGSGAGGVGSSGYAAHPGTPGYVWGGGCGGGGDAGGNSFGPPYPYGGQGGAGAGGGGGGAGNPGGTGGNAGVDGTGGILIIICRGAVTLTSGHIISALGSAGGAYSSGSSGGGGGSGGGSVSLFYGGTLTGTPNLLATGGAAGSGYFPGGAGGAGSTQYKTFAAMGWS